MQDRKKKLHEQFLSLLIIWETSVCIILQYSRTADQLKPIAENTVFFFYWPAFTSKEDLIFDGLIWRKTKFKYLVPEAYVP